MKRVKKKKLYKPTLAFRKALWDEKKRRKNEEDVSPSRSKVISGDVNVHLSLDGADSPSCLRFPRRLKERGIRVLGRGTV